MSCVGVEQSCAMREIFLSASLPLPFSISQFDFSHFCLSSANCNFTVGVDFPPLGDHDLRTVDSFGFLKSQLPTESAARADTPSLPPGLPLPLVHPSSSFQDQLNSSQPSSPAPLLPPGLTPNISRLNSPTKLGEDIQSRPLTPELTVGGPLTSSRVKDASQVSLGSPCKNLQTKPVISARVTLPSPPI